MPPLPTRYAGDSYAAILDAQITALGKANGVRPLPEMPAPLRGGFVPQLSNGQAVALIQSWRRAAARGRVTWPLWVDLEAYALGQRQSIDERFDMSRAFRQSAMPDEGLALLWASIAQLAVDLDDSSTVLRPVDVAWTDAAYEQGARDTWEAIKDHARKVPVPTPPRAPVPEVPKPPPGSGDLVDVVTDPLRPVRRAGTNILVIVALMFGAYYLATKD